MASGWTCGRCSAQNEDAAVSCRTCGMIRGGVVTQPNQGAPGSPDGPQPIPAPPPPDAFGYQGAPAPGGYPGAPVSPPIARGGKKQLATGLLANVGIRVGILLLIAAVGGAIAFVTNASRDSNGNITKGGDMKPADLHVGDCYDLPGGSGTADASASIENTHAVPCAEPHHFEVFYRGEMTGTTYPTADERHAWAGTYCVPAFEAYVGSTVDATNLTFYLFYPDNPGWTQGDRGAQCALADPNDAVLTGSMKGSKR